MNRSRTKYDARYTTTSTPAMTVSAKLFDWTSAVSSAAMLRTRATHENHRTARRLSRSMIGAMTSIPPRISSIMNTMDTPLNVYASVVVPITAAVATPERNVHRLGKGTLTPKITRRPAYFQNPAAVMNTIIATSEAIVVMGKNSNPVTARVIPGSWPCEISLVSALYGA